MKRCVKCKKEFNSSEDICPTDGQKHTTDALIGTVVDGKYRLEKLIGRGGMGSVYIASHTNFNKQVAVKILSQNVLEINPGAYERFRREAEACALFKHPNAVQVTDFGQTEDEIVYIVMEYIEGHSLRRILEKEKKLTSQRAVEISRQICAAISAAHRAGVIHRDLKPDNIMIEMVDGHEMARVLDFGIAKLKDHSHKLTETGGLLGTPHYMSPEQCIGAVVDQRADIYSLGIMLYEMLSGEVPFQGSVAPAIFIQHVTKQAESLATICPELPDDLVKVVMRAIGKNPDERQQSAAELAEHLEIAVKADSKKWRVVFYGADDDSPQTYEKLSEGLQQSFGVTPTQFSALMNALPATVKRTATEDEATKVAEKLISIGAVAQVEPIIPQPITTDKLTSLDTGNIRPTNQSETVADKRNTLNNQDVDVFIVDPLLVTDSMAMLSYATEQTKRQTIVDETANIVEPSESRPTVVNQPTHVAPNTLSISQPNVTFVEPPTKLTEKPKISWTLDIDGTFYQDISDEDIENWILQGRLLAHHKGQRGAGQWYELGTVPKLRRLFDEIAQNSQVETLPAETPKAAAVAVLGSFVSPKVIKFVVAVIIFYVLINLGLQYGERTTLNNSME
ncbi:MAG: serine/threonine protein kinase, partial [Blastocatellia bacterium]|nr:serine/threonine protein kinase [Blastocatellia bacterium]